MSNGMSLVFLPPGGGDTSAWGAHIARFSERHDPVTAIDMPGAGSKTDQKPLSSIAECSSYAEGHISALGLQDMVLIGYSMGGLIAQAMASRNPHHYSGLVLVATSARIKIMQEVLDLLQSDPVEARKLMDKFSRKEGEEYKEERPFSAETTHAYLKATNDYDARELTPSITTPTLVLHGDEDKTCPLKFGEWLHENIAGSQFKTYKGASHMLPQEFPQQMEDDIEAFLAHLS